MIWISILIISCSMCVHSNWIIIKYVSNWPITLVEGICASKTYGWKIFSYVMWTVLRNWKNLSLSLLLLLFLRIELHQYERFLRNWKNLSLSSSLLLLLFLRIELHQYLIWEERNEVFCFVLFFVFGFLFFVLFCLV